MTSADLVFAALATGAAWPLVCDARGPRAAGCAAIAVGSFFSCLLPAILVWAVLVVWRRDGHRHAVLLAAGAVASTLAFNGLLAVTLGYDPVAVLGALAPIYAHGIAAHRPYAFWLFGSPVAWLVMLGAPTAWIALRAVARGDRAAVALAAMIVAASVAGFTKAETERIWLPFVPLACVAAAALPIPRIRPLLLALVAQALLVGVLFDTVW